MFRIDLESGAILTSSGKKSHKQIHFTEAQIQTLELEFVQNNQIFIIPENAILSIAGDTCEDRNHPMFFAEGTIADDRKSVTFEINTATEEYFQRIHSSNTVCLVDIDIKLPDEKRSRRLTRFQAIADARIYIDGMAPVQLAEFYTKQQIDDLLSNTPTASYRYLTVDHIYFHQTYGAVSYLDANNDLTALGYIAEPISHIQLYLCSNVPAVTGNIVLACGSNQVEIPVTATPQLFDWQLQEAIHGSLNITRQCADANDTLKNSSGVVSAIVVEWRVY